MEKRVNYHRVTTGDIAKIRELNEAGVLRKDIAEQIGCSPSTVTYYLDEAGIPHAHRKKISSDVIEKIEQLSKQKIPQDEIADLVGVSKRTVRRYQQKAHIPASNRGIPTGQYRKDEPVWPVADKNEEVKMVKFDPSKLKTASTDTVTATSDIQKSGAWISVDDASIKISGKKTSFSYTISLLSGDILINTGYGADIPIDSRDLVAFGNELLDMAEKIEQIKKTFAV